MILAANIGSVPMIRLYLDRFQSFGGLQQVAHFCATFLLWVLLTLMLSACSRQQTPIKTVTGVAMGTAFTVKWVSQENLDDTDFAQSINKAIAEVEASMSTYMNASDLTGLNGAAVNVWHDVPQSMANLIQQSLAVGQQTDGAFDITIGAAVNAWGFGPQGKPETVPDAQQLLQLRDLVNADNIVVDVDQARVKKQGQVYIDLSAIAKGYGVDQVALWLDSQGVENYLVEIGGELKAKGTKPEQQPWRIAIESPVTQARNVFQIVRIVDNAIATSGNYRNYYEEAGIRYSHTLDPSTLSPVKHQLASVTVITKSAATADALATALMVMGEKKGPQWAKQNNVSAYFIYRDGSDYKAQAVAGFKSFMMQ